MARHRATTIAPSKGGQFILHAKVLPGNPYDGHTLKTVLGQIMPLLLPVRNAAYSAAFHRTPAP